MANAKNGAYEPYSKEWLEEEVPVKLFRDSAKYTDDVFVGLNGRTWMIKRGVEVIVPRSVALVLEQAQEQRESAAMNSDRLQSDFEASSASYGIII